MHNALKMLEIRSMHQKMLFLKDDISIDE